MGDDADGLKAARRGSIDVFDPISGEESARRKSLREQVDGLLESTTESKKDTEAAISSSRRRPPRDTQLPNDEPPSDKLA